MALSDRYVTISNSWNVWVILIYSHFTQISGVLYELTKQDDELPWTITIHFSKFPEEILFRCPNRYKSTAWDFCIWNEEYFIFKFCIYFSFREIVESHFMSCLKEADVLKHRGQVVSRMQKKDHNQLWLGLVNDKFDQFWSVNRRLMEPTSEDGFKYIPIRCYKEVGWMPIFFIVSFFRFRYF